MHYITLESTSDEEYLSGSNFYSRVLVGSTYRLDARRVQTRFAWNYFSICNITVHPARNLIHNADYSQ